MGWRRRSRNVSWDSIRYHKQIAQAGLMSMEPATGNIKAWVGGINWQHYQYDHVKQGKRQVGSTFKPFVYATAIMNLGYTPCTPVSNATYSKGKYTVVGRGGTPMLKDALAYSQNPVALRLIDATGVDKVIQLARDLGVQSDMPKTIQLLWVLQILQFMRCWAHTVHLLTLVLILNQKWYGVLKIQTAD